MVRDAVKQLRCDCGYLLEQRDVYASDHSDKPFTFKRFGHSVRKIENGKASMPGRRCPLCYAYEFKVEEQ